MDKPKVSVLIPVYNRRDLISETVNSVLNQTFQNFEIIIVDNQSTDNTYQVCLDLAKTDPRIKVYQNEENIGPVKNWQRCLELAQCEYVKILFSDDLIHPNFLEKTITYLLDPSVAFVSTGVTQSETFSGWKNCHLNQLKSSGYFKTDACIEKFLLGKLNTGTPGSSIFRKKDLQKNLLITIPSPSINNFSEHGAGIDILPILLTSLDYPQLFYFAEPLSFFRSHSSSISRTQQSELLSYYHQARIWFAENFTDPLLCKRTYIAVWLEAVKQSKNWINPFKHIKKYTQQNVTINLADMLIFGFDLFEYSSAYLKRKMAR